MTEPREAFDSQGRRIGMIAVIQRQGRLLTIRRAAQVRKPGKVCFPGGGLLEGELETQAVEREVHEELGVRVQAKSLLERSVSPWGTSLVWYHCELQGPNHFSLRTHEVAELFWARPQWLVEHPDLLESNAPFLRRLLQGDFPQLMHQ